ncbi:hypothetical protein OH768_49990 [Streptomyces sp. NBC_01622]|uniref:hypothetical protein n=1 Tax=Streptomyces sp. NBC_01622 TaxID=2975903 RepID=UPI00386FD865|nr:hypothetical protein OH768_49990 [Streptomyces sp. NBC_01622]
MRLDDFGERLLAAVDSRPPDASVLDAVRTFLTWATGLLAQVAAGDDEALVRLRTVHRVIADSPTLRAREQQAITDATTAPAARLAAEPGGTAETDEVIAYVAANALWVSTGRSSTSYADASWPTRHPINSPPMSAHRARGPSPSSRTASRTAAYAKGGERRASSPAVRRVATATGRTPRTSPP